MGAWGTGISSNDTFADVYDEFFEQYNNGGDPAEISTQLIEENRETIDDPDDRNNFWFALAQAQWECKQLAPDLLETVRTIIESGQDIEVWRELGADEKDLRKRQKVLEKFLDKLRSEKPRVRARKKPKKLGTPLFKKGTCLAFKLSNGNYGGAVVLEESSIPGGAWNLVAVTRIDQPGAPTPNDLEKAEILIRTYDNGTEKQNVLWILNEFDDDEGRLFEITGQINVARDFKKVQYDYSYGFGWTRHLIDSVNLQFEREKLHGAPKAGVKIEKYVRKRWLFW